MVLCVLFLFFLFFFQAEDGIRYLVRSRGLGDVYKRQDLAWAKNLQSNADYESSLQHFESILSNFPLEAAGRMDEIKEAMSVNYFEWGESLASSGSFESAIELSLIHI